jgi:hypothetical protein
MIPATRLAGAVRPPPGENPRSSSPCRAVALAKRSWRLTADHPGDPKDPYFRRQGRFVHLTPEQARHLQSEVDARWEVLRRRVEAGS